jgi:LCP family protein required for cell wall assembly
LAWALPALVLLAGTAGLAAYIYALSHLTLSSGETVPRKRADVYAWPLRMVDRLNVLIIGVDVTLDERRRVLNVSRADTLALVTFDPERRRIAVVSIPRDTRAQIPGHGETKINASHAYGGPALTVRTVEQLLGVKIDAYVKLGPESFARFIDAIGGVDLDVEKDMKYTDSWAGYTIDLKKGFQHLNGQQATGYIRFRHDELGDIGRVERQRKVLLALLEKMKAPSTILASPQLLRAFVQHTQTNLTSYELMALGLFALRTRDHPMEMQTLPGTFAPNYWEPDGPRVRAMVADVFYGVSLKDVADLPVEVVNGSGSAGVGARVAARINAMGFRSVTVRLAPTSVQVTTIVDRTGRKGLGKMVAVALGRAVVLRERPRAEPSITVLVARDAARTLFGGLPERRH